MKKKNNTWIIGASSGIGAALAKKISVEEGNIFLSARSIQSLESVKESLGIVSGGEVFCFPLDVVDLSKVAAVVEEIFEGEGVQRVIFMAALYDPMPLSELDMDISEKIIDVNLKGLLNVLSCIVPILREQKGAQIAICSSLAAYNGLPNAQPYAATKAAITNITESLKIEEEGLIDVKLISPGFVETRLTGKNSFHMPFLMSSEKAANYIVKGLSSNRFEIHFPKRFSMILKCFRFLPYSIYFRLARLLVPRKD